MKEVIKSTFAGLSLFLASPALAEAPQSCQPDAQLLFHCTFGAGMQQVSVCLSGDTASYVFGADAANPQLSLSGKVADLGYTPFDRTETEMTEALSFPNEDTSYAVRSTVTLTEGEIGIPDGAVILTLPDGNQRVLSCDPGSVTPANPSDGIGQLVAFAFDDPRKQLDACLNWMPPADCAGSLRNADIAQGRCTAATDPTDCWDAERLVWDAALSERLDTALALISERMGPEFGDILRVAQDSWAISRNLDCEVALLAPFAADSGKAQCLARAAATRMEFLDTVVAGAEFDG